jgi:hypothetical protein
MDQEMREIIQQIAELRTSQRITEQWRGDIKDRIELLERHVDELRFKVSRAGNGPNGRNSGITISPKFLAACAGIAAAIYGFLKAAGVEWLQ